MKAGADLTHGGVQVEVDEWVVGEGEGNAAPPAAAAEATVPAPVPRRMATFKRHFGAGMAPAAAPKRMRALSVVDGHARDVVRPAASRAPQLRPAPPGGRSLQEVYDMLSGASGGSGGHELGSAATGGGQPAQPAPPLPGPASVVAPAAATAVPADTAPPLVPPTSKPAARHRVPGAPSAWRVPRTVAGDAVMTRPLTERSTNATPRADGCAGALSHTSKSSSAHGSFCAPAASAGASGAAASTAALGVPASLGELRFCACPPTKAPTSFDLPLQFDSPAAYARRFMQALLAEVTAHAADAAQRYAAVAKHLANDRSRRPAPRCRHGTTRLGYTKKQGKNFGRPYFMCAQGDGPKCFFEWADAPPKPRGSRGAQPPPAEVNYDRLAQALCSLDAKQVHELETAARKADVRLYLSKGTCIERSGGAGQLPGGYSLHLGNTFEHSSAMAMHDLWVVASDPSFSARGGGWVALFTNAFHGTLGDGCTLRLAALGCAPAALSQGPNFRQARCAAIRVGNVAHELSLVQMLEGLPRTVGAGAAPLTAHLLGNDKGAAAISPLLPPAAAMRASTAAMGHMQQLALERGLNAEQREVLAGVARWLEHSSCAAFAPAAPKVPAAPLPRHGDSLNDIEAKLIAFAEALPEGLRLEVAAFAQAHREYNLRQIGEAVAGLIARGRLGAEHAPRGAPAAAQLVHGAFGSGKSTTLAAAVTVLARALDDAGDAGDDATRILVAGATNSAVDTVLRNLKAYGYDNFVRVGAMRRIHTDVMPHAVHSSGGGGNGNDEKDAIREIGQALREARGRRQRAVLMQELEAARAGQVKSRRGLVSTARVVGVTIASAAHKLLEGQRFRVLVLDEASQMVEPASVLPLIRFGAERLLAAGDPQQLPPVLRLPPPPNDSNGGLARTLFSRLVRLGARPTLLACTYRCHPALLRVPNELFYANRLRAGVRPAERAPLVEGLEALTFVDVSGTAGADKDFNQSPAEADLAALVVRRVCEAGLSAEQVGVICNFRKQVALVRKALDALGGEAAGAMVSTVDAFQGQEREIIIVSVAYRSGDLSFVEAPERLNVAITRARRHLLVLGDAAKLRRSRRYKALIDAAEVLPLDEARALIQHCVLTAHARESQSTDSEDDGAGGAGAGGEGGAVGGCHPDSVDSEELLRAGP